MPGLTKCIGPVGQQVQGFCRIGHISDGVWFISIGQPLRFLSFYQVLYYQQVGNAGFKTDGAIKIGAAGQRTVKAKYNVERFTKDWEKLFHQVIQSRTYEQTDSLYQ